MHPFRAAVEARDHEAMVALLDDDVVFHSPIAHRPYAGKAVVGAILGAVLRIFEDFEYEREIGDPAARDHALIFRCTVDGLQLQGCDFLTVNEAGKITDFTVMLRPLKAVMAFAERMNVEFAAAMAALDA
ncbi:nuclear transport factor 2 family protein [Skermania piniformis]|uniref:Nuclear transport factor 2 family protein n=1 Tax=Skermania pinensis TaxID=39122 RepID=A0ABX8S7T9_9ACTN|nr:nuclear transport factor 2 family protein [Skermania piniformis]QXQ13882.1 nuclear transport factor 2 family protein [Skermania piniformis]